MPHFKSWATLDIFLCASDLSLNPHWMSLPLKPITHGILHGGAWIEILSSGVINSYPQADKDKKKAEPNR